MPILKIEWVFYFMQMNKTSYFRIGYIFLLVGLLIVQPISRLCFSLPEGGEVVSGSAEFTYPDSSTLQINADDKTIINYQSFNIGENESVIINLPNVDNAVLNRVLGDSASQILGNLTCNGIFILINQNGIYFGPNANVDAAGLIASTRDITDSNFLSSNYVFEKLSPEQLGALLLNQGTINITRGGFGVLIAGAVENQGTIIASLGTVALAGGDIVTLNISGNKLISVEIDQATAQAILDSQGNPVTDQIKNTGTIQADGGVVLLKAESLLGIFDKAINVEGYVKADKFEEKAGVVKVVSSGNITVNGQISASQIIIGEENGVSPTSITMQTGSLTATEVISITGKILSINALAPLTEVYKKTGDINILSSKILDNLITLEGEDFNITYLKTNNLTLRTDNSINTNPGVIIQANQLKVIAKQFGSLEVPLNLEANLTYINRLSGSIEIMESLGLGTSIMLRGPPDGFGAIIYSKDTNLILEAEKTTLLGTESTYLYGNITFYNFNLTTPDKEIYFQSGKTYTFKGDTYIKGLTGYDGLIKLLSSQEGTLWYSDFSQANSINISYVAIRDAYNLGQIIKVKPSTNWGNTYNFDLDPAWRGVTANLYWSEPENWDTGTVPTEFDTVTFDSTNNTDSYVDPNFSGTIASLIISGYNGTIYLQRTLTVTGNYTQDSGTFKQAPHSLYLGSLTQTGGTFIAVPDILTVAGETNLLGGTFINDPLITVSGTAYASNETTVLTGTSYNVALRVNDGSPSTTTTSTTDGTWSFSNVSVVDGDTITIYFYGTSDGVAGTYLGNVVTITDGTDITGISLFAGHVVLRSDRGSTAITIADLVNYDSDNNTNLRFDAELGSPNTLSAVDELYINANDTFTPGGNVSMLAGGSAGIDLRGTWQETGTETLTFNGTGTFDSTGGGTFTAASGTVKFTQGATISGSQTFNNLTFNVGSSSKTFTISSGTTITVTGTLTLSGGDGSITLSGGTINAQGNITITNTGTVGGGSTNININGSGDQNLTGSGTAGQGRLSDVTVAKDTGTLYLKSTISVAGNWTYSKGTVDATTNNSTVVFYGTKNLDGQGTSATMAFDNVTFAGSTTLAGNLDVDGNLTINSASTLNTSGSNYQINVAGNWSNSGTFTSNSSKVTFDTNSTATIDTGGTGTTKDFYDFEVDKSGGTLQLTNNSLDIDGSLTITAGTLDLNGLNITTTTSFSNSGTLKLQGSESVSFNNDTDSGSVKYVGTTSYTGLVAGNNYYDLEFDGVGGSWTLNAALDVNRHLSITNGSLLASGYQINVAGNWTNTGTFTHGDNTVVFDGTSADQTITTAGQAFNNLTLNNTASSGSDDIIISGNLDVNGTFTITDGDLDISTNDPNVNLAGDLTVGANGTIDNSAYTGTWTFDGSGTSTLTDNTTSGLNYGAVTVDGSTKTLQFSSGVNTPTITFTTLTIGADDTVSLNGENTTITTLVNNNILQLIGSETVSITTMDTDSGVVKYVGASGTNSYTGLAAGNNYYNLSFDAASDTYTLNAALDVNNNLTITNGTLAAGSNSINIGSNFSNAGTFTTSGTTTFDATSTGKTITSGGASFNNLTFNGIGGGWTLQDALDVNNNLTITNGALSANGKQINVAGNWSNAGTFTHGNNTVTFDGTGTSIISGSNTFYNLTCITSGKQLTFTAGTTQTITGTLTLTGASGSLIVLKSSSDGTQWKIDPQGTRSISYVDVKDSNNINSLIINPSNSVNSGNNTNWFPVVSVSSTSTSTSTSTLTNNKIEEVTKATDRIMKTVTIISGPLRELAPGLGNVALGMWGELVSLEEGKKKKKSF